MVGEDGVVDQEAVGAVRSIVTEVAAAAAEGPVLEAASLAPFAANLSTNVPSEQEATVTVIDEPEAEEGVKTQPVAVPVLLKSAAANPETASEKVKV